MFGNLFYMRNLSFYRGCKRNVNGFSRQGWQCPIYNGIYLKQLSA